MIAALIFVVSVAALGQFFVSYCRAVLSSGRKAALSDGVRDAAHIESPAVAASDFARILTLARICPEAGHDTRELRAVRVYYYLLDLLERAARSLSPPVAAWAELERQGCAHFAAVTLDRRIAHSRELMRQVYHNHF